MLSKGNMGLFLTTLIESNAMKKLLALFVSAALMCPIWAVAQTTPSVIGTLNWYLSPGLNSGTVKVNSKTLPATYGQCIGPNCQMTGSVTIIQILATITSNGNNAYSITGQGTAEIIITDPSGINPFPVTFPGWGSMFLSGSNYMMTLMGVTSGVTYTMNCTLSASTLNGTCTGNAGDSSPITLITN